MCDERGLLSPYSSVSWVACMCWFEKMTTEQERDMVRVSVPNAEDRRLDGSGETVTNMTNRLIVTEM